MTVKQVDSIAARWRCRRRSIPRLIEPAHGHCLPNIIPACRFTPAMSTGATDGIYPGGDRHSRPMARPGWYGDPDGNGVHGLNERAIVKAVYTGRDYLYDLVKAYAG